MKKAMLFILLVIIVAINAQPYWNANDFRNFQRSYNNYKNNPFSSSKYTPSILVSYPYEFNQSCNFVASWQLLDEDSSEFGGIIEAEEGELREVIQTDNTQESVLIWSQHKKLYSSEVFHEYLERSLIYCENFPAYHEEVSEYSSYYPFWNSGLGMLMIMEYVDAYDDSSWLAYGDSCAEFLMDSMLVFRHEHDYYENLHGIVSAFGAGCLYKYGQFRDNSDYIDRAIFHAERAKERLEEEPEERFAMEVWAMSTGTVMWGLVNSYFQENPEELDSWLDTYYSYLPVMAAAPTEYDPYIWDNSWNIWYANGYRAIWEASGDSTSYYRYRSILDYLLAQDTDDDGGIPASYIHPVTEDMSWVTTYLLFMGLEGIYDTLPEYDVTSLSLKFDGEPRYFLEGDTLKLNFSFANAGISSIDGSYDIYIDSDHTTDAFSLEKGERLDVTLEHIFTDGGTHSVIAVASSDDDINTYNDTISFFIDITPLVTFYGSIIDTNEVGIPAKVYFSQVFDDSTILFDSVYTIDGSFNLPLPGIYYDIEIIPEYPFPSALYEDHYAGSDGCNLFEIANAMMLFVDDDGGDIYDSFILDALYNNTVSYFNYKMDEMSLESVSHSDFTRSILLWHCGLDSIETITESDIVIIEDFINNGGFVIISGQYISNELAGSEFLEDFVGVRFIEDRVRHFMHGVPDDPITGAFEWITSTGVSSAGNAESNDVLLPLSSEPIIVHNVGDSTCVAVRKEFPSGGKLVYFGMSLESLGQLSEEGSGTRENMLRSAFEWFNTGWSIEESPCQIDLDIKAFPNPYNSSVQIDISNLNLEPTSVKIVDITGRELFNKTIYSLENTSLVWNSENLDNGVYLLQITNSTKLIVKKLILVK